jgi:SNF2 family DNA or RNA helicase
MKYGSLHLDDLKLIMRAEPHVLIRAKRIFSKADASEQGKITLSLTPDTCRDMLWFIDRYPLEMDGMVDMIVSTYAAQYHEKISRMRDFLHPDYQPPVVKLAKPARQYQLVASKLMLENGFLLLADDVGLGKTAEAICNFVDKRTLPAIVVTLTHLPEQWSDEVKKFIPELRTWVTPNGALKPIPKVKGSPPDVVISSYSKLVKWADVLSKYGKSVVFDEAQSLRRPESARYDAAKHLAAAMQFKWHLTATPIYNYGGEIFHVIEVIAPGLLGTFQEFQREWCEYEITEGPQGGNARPKLVVKDPKALGTYLRENFIMLRRTRAEVKRELPPSQRIVQKIDCDKKALDKIENDATALAKIILAQGEQYKGQKLNASEQFSNKMRQATGIAKAPFVAEFINILLEQEKNCVVFAWHREVYDILMKLLEHHNPVMYTGSESARKKQEAKSAFMRGDSKVILISLRAGAGLDGLQFVTRTTVTAELDWSPGVMFEQNEGRVYRDGQPDPVTSYYLVAKDGADPIMMDVVGLKDQQSNGVINPDKDDIQRLTIDPNKIKRLAQAYLEKRKILLS